MRKLPSSVRVKCYEPQILHLEKVGRLLLNLLFNNEITVSEKKYQNSFQLKTVANSSKRKTAFDSETTTVLKSAYFNETFKRKYIFVDQCNALFLRPSRHGLT